MRRRIQLHAAVAVFLLITAIAIWLILQNNKKNSFRIQNDDNANIVENSTGNKQKSHGQQEKTIPDNTPEKQKTDWAWAIEKYRDKEIIKIATSEKKVALTFDAGANADGVDKILPILAENDIEGTFFLTGKFIEKYPDKVQKIIATGGDLGNHTYDHPYLTKLSDEQIGDEIQKAEDALGKLNAKFQPFLRSPYGDRNQSTMNVISNTGYINIRWTIDSLGWKGTSGGVTKESVQQKVLKNTAPGAIIMMHLGSNPDDKTHLDSEALPDIIAELKQEGYEFVTLSELLELGK